MSKQKLEHYVSQSLKHFGNWYLKLQVMPLAHTTSPADFIVITQNYNYLIECKQVTCKSVNCKEDMQGTRKNYYFYIDRLTQNLDLLSFENVSMNNRAFVILLFWHGSLKKSNCFIIPIQSFNDCEIIVKKSLTEEYCLNCDKIYKLSVLPGSILDISNFIV